MKIFLIWFSCLVIATAQNPNRAQLTLVDENGFNQFEIKIGASGFSDTDTTTLTGTADITLDIDPSKGTTRSIFINDADINASDLSFELGFFFAPIAELDARNLKGTAFTPLAGGTVNPLTGEFDASLHTFTIDEGIITGDALGSDVNSDISEAPITGAGNGQGTISLENPIEGEGRKIFYDVTITLPVEINDVIPVDGGINANVEVSGTLKATGTIFIIRPLNYQEWSEEEGIAPSRQDEFDLHPHIPNDVLYAMGHSSETVPTDLFILSDAGLQLNTASAGMRAEVIIEHSSDFQNWAPLPANLINSRLGNSPIVSITERRGFFRVSADE